MTTITKYVVALVLCLFVANVGAQETEADKAKDSIRNNSAGYKDMQIDKLLADKKRIETQEKDFLKADIEGINRQLDEGKITAGEAEQLKKEAAKKRAANIQDRLAIIDKKIDLIKRNPYAENLDRDNTSYIGFVSDTEGGGRIGLSIKSGNKRPPKYDIRTSNKMLFALGFNNAIGDEQSLDDSPYKLGGSGFVELGWVWQTRIFKESNFARINYGFSFQWNKFDIKNNQYFVENGNQTTLQTFSGDLKSAKFRVTNLVLPVHLEFGPSRKKDYGNRVRYFTDNNFKIGLGGYGGVRLGSMQKLVFEDADGDRVKTKEKRNFNASNFVYGLSGYVGWGDLAIYAKYDLSPLFKDQAFEQNNVSLGLRWDLD